MGFVTPPRFALFDYILYILDCKIIPGSQYRLHSWANTLTMEPSLASPNILHVYVARLYYLLFFFNLHLFQSIRQLNCISEICLIKKFI